jgi:pyruvate-formate lyase-activating enzyme
MAKRKVQPHLVVADEKGDIYDHPELLMVCRRGREVTLPRPDELIPLPEESELFLLPGRHAVGYDPETGQLEAMDEVAVAGFASPGHTLAGLAAYQTAPRAPRLPLFAYGAVGFADDRFWIMARKVDDDPRQIFTKIPRAKIESGAKSLLRDYPDNRLLRHLSVCALTFSCPAARNLALGRYECPLPTSRTCNASCLGCLSEQPADAGFPATQDRIAFRPTPEEIAEVMRVHESRAKRPIYSFGQGCEGEPLTEAETIAAAIRLFREGGGTGTININTNASLPQTIEPLAAAGLDAIRVSLNAADERLYDPYYRPKGYTLADVEETARRAKQAGLFVSINHLFFPGVNDTESQLEAMAGFIERTRADFVQMRNLNLDPELYLDLIGETDLGPCMGLRNFMKRLKKVCPWIEYGYFNPYLGEK